MTERWEIILEGHRVDQQDAQHAFPSGPVRVGPSRYPDGAPLMVLWADDLKDARTAEEAHRIGLRLVDWLNGALFVIHADHRRLTAGNVIERDGAGNFVQGFAIASMRISLPKGRARFVGQAIGPDGQPLPPPPQPHERWFELASSDDVAADVLVYLSRELDWFDIWKAFEAMRDDWNKVTGGTDPAAMRWPRKKDLDRFRLSAQVHRHSKVKWTEGYDMQTAMPLKEARKVVRELAEKWLAWRVSRMT